MFARFVCALVSFLACEYPKKSETWEPGEIIVECTSYITSSLTQLAWIQPF